MQRQTGSNHKNIKLQNRLLILQLIAADQPVSRVDLAHKTGLTKMTVGNIVADLIEENMIEEIVPDGESESTAPQGRPPILLKISSQSSAICGMLIKRGFCQVILADLSGLILSSVSKEYPGYVGIDDLYQMLVTCFWDLKAGCSREIAAIGIASVGPINSTTGMILNPPEFYGIENVPIVARIQDETGLPVFLINDADAGALAEKLYGIGRKYKNFTYLHFMNGIGAGFILENKLYRGDFGQCGEIGHTTINFSGPRCSCGNRGCLELYANVDRMRERAKALSHLYKGSALLTKENPDWNDFVDNANRRDTLALAVLDEFCEYVSFAMINLLNLLNISLVIVGYNANAEGTAVEQLLSDKIALRTLGSRYKPIVFRRSCFLGDAPLIGAIAAVADKIFSGELKLIEEKEEG